MTSSALPCSPSGANLSTLQDSLYVAGCGFALLSQEVTTLQHHRSPNSTGCLLRGCLTITATGLPPVSRRQLIRTHQRGLGGNRDQRDTITWAGHSAWRHKSFTRVFQNTHDHLVSLNCPPQQAAFPCKLARRWVAGASPRRPSAELGSEGGASPCRKSAYRLVRNVKLGALDSTSVTTGLKPAEPRSISS